MFDLMEIEVGDRLGSAEEIRALPEGSRVRQFHDGRYIYALNAEGLVPEGGWARGHDPITSLRHVGAQAYQHAVHSRPDAPQMTFRQYQWMWRDMIRAGSEYAGGTGSADVTHALERFSITPDLFPPGVGMRVEAMAERNALPDGSQVMLARPNLLDYYAVWERRRDGWVHVLGQGIISPDQDHTRTVVVRVGQEHVRPAWLDEVGTEQDAALIAGFKAKMWRIGQRARDRHAWCTTFNAVMARVGITAECEANDMVGAVVTPESAIAALPVGTVVKWTHTTNAGCWAYFMRVDEASNVAGLALLVGYRNDGQPLRQYARSVEVIADAQEVRDGGLMVPLNQVYEHLPVGTVVGYRGSRWAICEDRRLASGATPHTAGAYAVSDVFGGSTHGTVISIPGTALGAS